MQADKTNFGMPGMSNSISSAGVPAEDGLRLRLDDAAAMLRLGEATGRLLAGDWRATKPAERVRAVLLHGPLGAGKTTFVRGFVEALPGSEAAEVSSPSFTLCNSYPTRPPVLHCDLYRSEDLTPDGTLASLPEEVDEALEAGEGIILVEWAERLPAPARPTQRLDIYFQVCQNSRFALLVPHGAASARALAALKQAL